MAIRINIGTVFDNKGLNIAKRELRTLSSSVESLGRNFAIAGAAIGGIAVGLGKAVMTASNFEAEFEGVNQVFKEAAGSVQAFAEQAAKSAGLSATEALQASKTFGLFATGAGLGVEAAADFSTTMVQLAGDLGSFNDVPTADALAAIQSGLMGQSEPLRKFGVFLDDARLKQEALNMGIYNGEGPLSTQQKMMASYSAILSQTTVQQGDFVKYQDTLGNQLKTISADFSNLTRDIGMMLIPVITEAMPQIRELATALGQELKNAIGSIDWKSLIQSVVDFTKFIVNNATTIANLVIGLFALNTAFKLVTVAMAFGQVAMTIYTGIQAAYTTGTSLATIATTLLGNAMRLIPFVAVVGAIGLVINGVMNLGTEANKGAQNIRILNGQITTGAQIGPEAANQYAKVAGGFVLIKKAADDASLAVEAFNKPSDSESRNRRHELREQNRRMGLIGSQGAFSLPDFSSLLASATGGSGNLQAELDRIARESEKAAEEAAKESARIMKEADRAAADAAEDAAGVLRDIENQAQADADRAADTEQERLDKRLRGFQSFADSVKSLFGQIKESILSSFDLPKLGNSVNSITRNIAKLLDRTKNFANNISQLSGLGLNSALLQQVIQAGPMAGSQLAQAIVGGGSAFVGQLNQAYGEFGGLASDIAGVGTRSAFANQEVVNNYYQIEVSGGVGSGPTIGRAIVDAIKSYERTSGAVWQGAS